MILFRPTTVVPDRFRPTYRLLRAALFLSFLALGATFLYRTLFPSQTFSFSFRNPDTSKNTLEDPVDSSGQTVRRGRLPDDGSFTTFAGSVGSFSSVKIRLSLADDSAVPDDGIRIAVRKSFRSFYYPLGDPIQAMPAKRAIAAEGVPYLFSTDTLYPFVSARAALSWCPKDKILAGSSELLSIFPPREERVGFRPGSLVSDAQGVYAIGGDDKAHPIGSTDAFNALGFHWNDVVAVDEEELGFHKRGKILLFDAAQPDGTVFRDTATGMYSIVTDGRRLPIQNRDYLSQLLGVTTPIDASGDSLSTEATCTLRRSRLSVLQPTYECDLPLSSVGNFPGDSFSVSLRTDRSIHAADFSVTLATTPDRSNLSLFLNQIRDRFAATYGKR